VKMLEKITNNKLLCCILFIFCIVFLGSFMLQGRRVQTGTDAAVESIKQNATGAADSIAAGQREIGKAEQSIREAGATVGEIRAAVQSGKQSATEVSNGINKCSELIDKSLQLNRRAQEIMSGIDQEPSGRTSEGEKR